MKFPAYKNMPTKQLGIIMTMLTFNLPRRSFKCYIWIDQFPTGELIKGPKTITVHQEYWHSTRHTVHTWEETHDLEKTAISLNEA